MVYQEKKTKVMTCIPYRNREAIHDTKDSDMLESGEDIWT
jgi:hypothetical protein